MSDDTEQDSFDTLRIRGHRVVKAEQSAALDRHHASEATS